MVTVFLISVPGRGRSRLHLDRSDTAAGAYRRSLDVLVTTAGPASPAVAVGPPSAAKI
jgi:hypothetical protein